MGVIFFVINATFALVIILLVLWTFISAIITKNPETRYQPMQDDRDSFIKSKTNLDTELDALGATARGDTSKRMPIDGQHEVPLGWTPKPENRGQTGHLQPHDAMRNRFGTSQERFGASMAPPNWRDDHSRRQLMYPQHPLARREDASPSRYEGPQTRSQNTTAWQRGLGY
jgi:Transient receptor potential (TRP) ion channel